MKLLSLRSNDDRVALLAIGSAQMHRKLAHGLRLTAVVLRHDPSRERHFKGARRTI
jgi:hypothetical protein